MICAFDFSEIGDYRLTHLTVSDSESEFVRDHERRPFSLQIERGRDGIHVDTRWYSLQLRRLSALISPVELVKFPSADFHG